MNKNVQELISQGTSTIVGAVVFFLILPLFFSRIMGWRGVKAQIGLVLIAALYWLYNWYID